MVGKSIRKTNRTTREGRARLAPMPQMQLR